MQVRTAPLGGRPHVRPPLAHPLLIPSPRTPSTHPEPSRTLYSSRRDSTVRACAPATLYSQTPAEVVT